MKNLTELIIKLKITDILENEKDLNKATLDIWNLKLKFFKTCSDEELNLNLFGINNCPYCIKYIRSKCRKCPIAKFSKKILCDGTPYTKLEDYFCDGIADREQLLKLINDEIRFLKKVIKNENN